MEDGITERLQNFVFSKKETAGIDLDEKDIALSFKECSKSLVGKIFGTKKVNFIGLKSTLISIWQTREAFAVQEIGENAFQFVFRNTEDKDKVLTGKPWSFDNQYLLLKAWDEMGNMKVENFNSVELWIQVWNLPLHWVAIDTGFKIGKLFENVLDVIIPEKGSIKGRFVKMLVEINLDKPLIRGTHINLGDSKVWVDFSKMRQSAESSKNSKDLKEFEKFDDEGDIQSDSAADFRNGLNRGRTTTGKGWEKDDVELINIPVSVGKLRAPMGDLSNKGNCLQNLGVGKSKKGKHIKIEGRKKGKENMEGVEIQIIKNSNNKRSMRSSDSGAGDEAIPRSVQLSLGIEQGGLPNHVVKEVGQYYIYVSSSKISDGGVGLSGLVLDAGNNVVMSWCSSRDFISSSVGATLQAVRLALVKAVHFKWAKISIHLDAKEIVHKLCNNSSFDVANMTIAEDIFLMNILFEFCSFNFVCKSQNLQCNRLAMFALEGKATHEWLSHLPSWM
ncbi:hypothetical protein DH2020_003588 [Rehmannia glutinosa]|uniref:DUF4283 domain-containing protein n=1 Tax=Rehmannia glutinosa TaxID=99300 RepID=A0ABR0XM20_REHGL